ncbi:MAG TPA: hypothetical protein VGC08_04005 [Pedobacter sp.]
MLQENEYTIALKEDLANTRQYRVNQDISYSLEDFEYHNEIEADVSVTLEKRAVEGYVFTIKLLRQWQLKTDGLDRWDLDMAQLRKNLVVETDVSGQIQQVLNIEEIKALWQNLKPAISSKYGHDEESKTVINSGVELLHTPGELERVLQTSYLYHGLLPGLYHQPFNRDNDFSVKGSRVIPNSIGTAALTFNTVAKLHDYDSFTGACRVKIDGELDQESLDKEKITALLRGLTDIYNLNTHVEGFHLEDYSFDRHHWITESAQLTQYAIEGTLMYRNLCTVKPLED